MVAVVLLVVDVLVLVVVDVLVVVVVVVEQSGGTFGDREQLVTVVCPVNVPQKFGYRQPHECVVVVVEVVLLLVVLVPVPVVVVEVDVVVFSTGH